MNRTRISVIRIVVCILSLLLIVEAGFVSVAWTKPRTFHIVSGYAKFRDSTSDMIRSDLKDQYMDCYAVGGTGEDRLLLYIYDDTGDLFFVKFFAGRMTYFYPERPPSSRRVNFGFDFPESTVKNAVYDILFQWKDKAGSYQRSLNDNTIHANIYVKDGGIDVFEFVVDPGWEGTDPKAITQATVDAFYPNDTNWDYEDTSESDERNQILYRLDYGSNAFRFDPVGYDSAGKPKTWLVVPPDNSSPVKLQVARRNRKDIIVYLAEFPNGLPFQFAVSRESLENFNGFDISNGAPGKNSNISTTWGELKSE